MEVHEIKNKGSYCDDESELEENELEYLEALGLDEIWYWYATAPYEGDGSILMRKGDLYCVDSLGHCSCYGPTENITFDGVPIGDLKKKHSEGLLEEADILIKKAFSK